MSGCTSVDARLSTASLTSSLEDFRWGNNMVDPAPFFFGYLGEHAAFYNVGARQLAGDVSFRGDLYQASRRQYLLYIVQ
jgi:hypothetical protein